MTDQLTPYGEYTLWEIKDDIWTPRVTKKNKLMVSWGYVACRCLGFADPAFRISKMYVEYENTTGTIGDVSFTKFDANLSYYSGLGTDKDYLRLDLDGDPTIEVASGYETYFGGDNAYTQDPYDGNKLHFVARTAGTAGVNGVSFGNSYNSKIYGVALVAATQGSSNSGDILVSRGYIDTSDHVAVSSGVQVGVTWDITFPPAD